MREQKPRQHPNSSTGKPTAAAMRNAVPQAKHEQNGEGRGLGDFRVIVIGASAGGVEAISRVIENLPPDLAAAVFVVLHVSPTCSSMLPEILSRAGRLPAKHAQDGEQILPAHIYIAPPDHHLLIKSGKMIVTRGPRENSARPAVDPLFRTAARHYGPWVIGVVLSGGLDDGTIGLMDIKRFDGIAIVQDPDEAMFPSMPSSAVENVTVDYVVRLQEIGSLLTRLSREPVADELGAAFMARDHRNDDFDIAEVGTEDLKRHNMNGPPSKFTCPECGGALWELENGKLLRYRCHVGHGYTAESLMAAQSTRLEDALWSALRALEETAGMRRRMASRARQAGWGIMATNYDEQAAGAEVRAGVIRSVLVEDAPGKTTARSARKVAKRALQAVDPDAGTVELSQLPEDNPPGNVMPPNPTDFQNGPGVARPRQSKGSLAKHTGRPSTRKSRSLKD